MSESTSLLRDTSEDAPKKRLKMLALVAGAIIGIVGVVTVIVTLSLQLTADPNNNSNNNSNNNNQCSDYEIRYTPFAKTEPSFNVDGTGILLQNATIWKANGDPIQYNTDILLLNGKISQIGKALVPQGNVTVFNVNGQWVTPGLVDTHSHIGVYSYPEDAWATQDGNEATNPVLPYLRAIDGLNPNDPAIPLIRSGGVTTSLVLPGSANVQGGEAAYVKLRGSTVYDMLIPNAPRALKMACGENPKRVYGSMGVMPDSRLGIGALQRSQWYKAATLKQQQDAYDCNPQGLRPFDIELEPLVAVLNGQARLMVHCYKVEDFEMMLRTADEFDFEIATFQHALEAWKVPNMMRDNNITVATFADNWGFKMEGFWASVWAPKILEEAGVNLALKSDHPVLFAKYLIWEATKATHYGLSAEKAMQSVTLAPAKGMGIDDRVGTLDIGKEADVVVWDRYPLQLGAQANIVIIDGQLIDNYNLPSVPRPSQTQAAMVPSGPTACTNASNAFLVTGAKIYTMDESDTIISGSILVGSDGLVKCIGECNATEGADIYTSNGGIVLPGVVSVGAYVGLLEVESESNSMDGSAQVLDGETIRAVDGVTFNTFDPRHMYTAWAGGVTTIVAGPISSDVVAGISVAFSSHGITVNDALIQEEVSLNINIGNKAKSSSFTGSISGQFAYLRSLFKANSTAFSQVMDGTLPLVVFVDQVDQIASLLRLKKEFSFNLVIVGGGEAHIIAKDLAAANVSVIFTRPPPHTFETAKTVDNALTILDKAGVKVAVTTLDMSFTRNIRWEAGFAVSEGLEYYTGLKAITKNPAQMLGIYQTGTGSIQVNNKANFVLYSSDPLAIGGQVQLVALGSFTQCNPVPL